MSDKFNKVKKIHFDPLKQIPINVRQDAEKPLETEFEDQVKQASNAAVLIEEYDKTIELQKFVEELVRDAAKVEVEIDPEENPEVWLAMNRVFSNPSPKMNQDSYFQVIDALEEMDKIDMEESNPRKSDEKSKE